MDQTSNQSDFCLLCRVSEQLWAIPLNFVIETLRPLAFETFPSLPSCVSGVSIVRGAPTPVIHAPALLSACPNSGITRWVVLRLGDKRAALAVDSVQDVRALPEGTFLRLPALLTGLDPDVIGGVRILEQDIAMLLRASRLIPDDVWRSLQAVESET